MLTSRDWLAATGSPLAGMGYGIRRPARNPATRAVLPAGAPLPSPIEHAKAARQATIRRLSQPKARP
ncbi:MAG: hypothetical protein RQ966_12865 [Acetobacteraceae bacterium]|nr:hypothetical protein [Acetobacteraceae bacterium]